MKRSGYKKKKKQPVKNRGYKYLAIPLFNEAVLFDKTIGSCRWMYNHMLSDRTEAYDIIGVEDIDMKAMSQCLKLGKSTMDNGYGMFRNMLSYKLEESGKVFIKVDKFFPSSQLCHECKTKHSITKDLKVRYWTCPTCGAEHERDINAALNIREEALRIYAM